MIKINEITDDNFLALYKEQVISKSLLPKFKKYFNTVDLEHKNKIEALFPEESLIELTFCGSSELSQIIDKIYKQVPSLAEFYCPEYFFVNFEPNYTKSDINELDLRKPENTDAINELFDETKNNLLLTLREYHATQLIKFLSLDNYQLTTAQKKKKLLDIFKLKNGTLRLSEKIKFPIWVKDFSNVFDYESMSNRFGYEITKFLEIEVCPYCNQEEIPTIAVEGAKTRPSLDHFYPKSKFPFLATTLSNLVPSGKRCNEDYKKAKSMIGFANPYHDAVKTDESLFYFKEAFSKEFELENVEVVVNTNDNALHMNMYLFNISLFYNQTYKSDFIDMYEKKEFLKEIGLIDKPTEISKLSHKKIKHLVGVDLNKPSIKYRLKKYKVDSLNHIFGSQFKTDD